MSNFYFRWAVSTWFGLLYQNRYSAEWDKALNRLIDRFGALAVVDRHRIVLGPEEVWIENAFYCYGYQCNTAYRFRPSLKTMLRLDSLIRGFEKAGEAAHKAALNEVGK